MKNGNDFFKIKIEETGVVKKLPLQFKYMELPTYEYLPNKVWYDEGLQMYIFTKEDFAVICVFARDCLNLEKLKRKLKIDFSPAFVDSACETLGNLHGHDNYLKFPKIVHKKLKDLFDYEDAGELE